MAPSLTETLYALGLGDRVVGVSRDCHYPPEVEQVQKTGNVGGYYDPNLEAIVALKPDLVVMLEEQAAAMPNFEKLRIETLAVNQQTIEGVIESVRRHRRQVRPRAGRATDGPRLAGAGRSHPPADAEPLASARALRARSHFRLRPSRRSVRRRRRQLHRYDDRLGRRQERLLAARRPLSGRFDRGHSESQPRCHHRLGAGRDRAAARPAKTVGGLERLQMGWRPSRMAA